MKLCSILDQSSAKWRVLHFAMIDYEKGISNLWTAHLAKESRTPFSLLLMAAFFAFAVSVFSFKCFWSDWNCMEPSFFWVTPGLDELEKLEEKKYQILAKIYREWGISWKTFLCYSCGASNRTVRSKGKFVPSVLFDTKLSAGEEPFERHQADDTCQVQADKVSLNSRVCLSGDTEALTNRTFSGLNHRLVKYVEAWVGIFSSYSNFQALCVWSWSWTCENRCF